LGEKLIQIYKNARVFIPVKVVLIIKMRCQVTVANEPSDFRPISVSTSFATMLEALLLEKMHCLKEINLNQFTKKRSCKHSYFLVNETINYYKQNGSNY
jgi:hypothetical protein